MKFMMMMNTPRGEGGQYKINEWSPDDFKAHIAFMQRYNAELRDAGEFVDAQGLTPPSEATLVRAGARGEPVTDAPFPPTKEFLAGYWVIDVHSAARALELAAKVSAAPGPGGKPLNMGIEVRPIMEAPAPA